MLQALNEVFILKWARLSFLNTWTQHKSLSSILDCAINRIVDWQTITTSQIEPIANQLKGHVTILLHIWHTLSDTNIQNIQVVTCFERRENITNQYCLFIDENVYWLITRPNMNQITRQNRQLSSYLKNICVRLLESWLKWQSWLKFLWNIFLLQISHFVFDT